MKIKEDVVKKYGDLVISSCPKGFSSKKRFNEDIEKFLEADDNIYGVNPKELLEYLINKVDSEGNDCINPEYDNTIAEIDQGINFIKMSQDFSNNLLLDLNLIPDGMLKIYYSWVLQVQDKVDKVLSNIELKLGENAINFLSGIPLPTKSPDLTRDVISEFWKYLIILRDFTSWYNSYKNFYRL